MQWIGNVSLSQLIHWNANKTDCSENICMSFSYSRGNDNDTNGMRHWNFTKNVFVIFIFSVKMKQYRRKCEISSSTTPLVYDDTQIYSESLPQLCVFVCLCANSFWRRQRNVCRVLIDDVINSLYSLLLLFGSSSFSCRAQHVMQEMREHKVNLNEWILFL